MPIEAYGMHLSVAKPSGLIEKIQRNVHSHSTALRRVETAICLTGLGLVLASIPLLPFVGLWAVALTLTGGVLCVATKVAFFALKILVPFHYDMREHLFKTGKCPGGELTYQNDLPVLSLDYSQGHRQAGYAQGYLTGEALNQIARRLSLVLKLSCAPSANQLAPFLEKIKEEVPAEYLEEIEGIIAGYNQWIKEQAHCYQFPYKLTANELLMVHLMPDSIHLDLKAVALKQKRRGSTPPLPVGCSFIAEYDERRGSVIARNMDWPSFGKMGRFTALVKREGIQGKRSTAEVAIPGFVGTLTGLNSEGLALAMNVCIGETTAPKGMPAAFYNRACLESCGTLQEVDAFVKAARPLGAYHLSVADKEGAVSFNFYPCKLEGRLPIPALAPGEFYTRREMGREHPFLMTFNQHYFQDEQTGKILQVYRGFNDSAGREGVAYEFFNKRKGQPLETILALPRINTPITTQRIVIIPGEGSIQVGFDDAYAGTQPLQHYAFRPQN